MDAEWIPILEALEAKPKHKFFVPSKFETPITFVPSLDKLKLSDWPIDLNPDFGRGKKFKTPEGHDVDSVK